MSLWDDIKLTLQPWDWFSGSGKKRILSNESVGNPLHGLKAQYKVFDLLKPWRPYEDTKNLIQDPSRRTLGKLNQKHIDAWGDVGEENWPVGAAYLGYLGAGALGGAGGGAGASSAGSSAPWGFGPGMSFEAATPTVAGATPGINPMVGAGASSSAAGIGGSGVGMQSLFGGWRTPGINPNAGAYPSPQISGGVLGDGASSPGADARMAAAAALLASSGYSPTKTTNAEAIGRALMAAQQSKALALKQIQEQQEAEQMQRYREAQIAAMQTPDDPNSVREFEYAKRNGFEGSYMDWVVAGGQSSRPSAVQEWEFYNSLPDEQKKLYLEMKRNPNFTVKEVGGVPTAIDQTRIGGAQQIPLSSLPAEVAAAGAIKQGEVEGAGRGEQTTVFNKKATGARNTIKDLDLAEPLIDAATGSLAGAGRDKLAAVFGRAPEGAQAIARLKVLQASLMTSMPRMEGPQSDRDVQLYREAAGQIGDPTVPAAIKKAAVQTIRDIQRKYTGDAGDSDPLGIR